MTNHIGTTRMSEVYFQSMLNAAGTERPKRAWVTLWKWNNDTKKYEPVRNAKGFGVQLRSKPGKDKDGKPTTHYFFDILWGQGYSPKQQPKEQPVVVGTKTIE